ncbi:hypothetical protein K7X08_034707 [Anisodus acutangulus]|uniref:Uncharacterized protein n=1 Tax=Anisodus acutangulus TaxID=402998 RepID=A0A9Q1LJA0_9SOLA|nr:hypothetical protein K7X08_034707 [Anisodus acutangulus]
MAARDLISVEHINLRLALAVTEGPKRTKIVNLEVHLCSMGLFNFSLTAPQFLSPIQNPRIPITERSVPSSIVISLDIWEFKTDS